MAAYFDSSLPRQVGCSSCPLGGREQVVRQAGKAHPKISRGVALQGVSIISLDDAWLRWHAPTRVSGASARYTPPMEDARDARMRKALAASVCDVRGPLQQSQMPIPNLSITECDQTHDRMWRDEAERNDAPQTNVVDEEKGGRNQSRCNKVYSIVVYFDSNSGGGRFVLACRSNSTGVNLQDMYES